MPTKILDIRNEQHKVGSKKESRTLLKYCMKCICGKMVKYSWESLEVPTNSFQVHEIKIIFLMILNCYLTFSHSLSYE